MIFNMQLSEDASLAELSDIRVGVDGTVYPSAGDAVRGQITDVKEDLNSIEKFEWSNGFVNVLGNIDGTAYSDRKHTNYLLCPPETSIDYIGETNHSGVLGISFYDEYKRFISGVANNGTIGTVQTVTSPAKTRYCILSTKTSILGDSYYLPQVQNLEYVTNKAYDCEKFFNNNRTNGFLRFITNGTNRGQIESIDGLLYAEVVDSSYQIALYYLTAGGSATNTGWVSSVVLANYKEPYAIEIRKADNSTMAVGSANRAVKGTYTSWLATNEFVYQSTNIAYVDGTDGDDSNNGINPTTAFKTIKKALDSGYKKILVREGVYTETINLSRKNGINISINHSYSHFDAISASTNPKVIIDCDGTLTNGVVCINCSNCSFDGIEVKNATQTGWIINACEGMLFNDCVSHDCATGHGFAVINTNADFINCGCYNIGTYGGNEHRDGFNLSGTGTQNLKNCWANYCEDDGVSHHDACVGFVDGGEWHHCGKGGVATPTHGAKVDVLNIYSHDCKYGIYAGNDTSALAKTFNITNCACLNNTVKDIFVENNSANIWNCIYNSIDHSGTGTNNVLSTI